MTSRRVATAVFAGTGLACIVWVVAVSADGSRFQAAQAQSSATAPQPQEGAEQVKPTFSATVDLVTVDVSVVDRDGRPVRGLDADDFELEVDGEPRRIVSAQFVEQSAASGPPPSTQYSTNEGAEGGRLIMLVVDQGNIRRGTGAAFMRAAERLLDDLGPGDRVAVAFIPGGRTLDFTRHLTLVRRMLRQSLGEADTPVGPTAMPRVGVTEALAYRRGDTSVLREVDARVCSTVTDAADRQLCVNDLTMELEQLGYAVWQRTENSLNVLRQLLGGLASVAGPKTVVMLTEGLYIDREVGLLASVGSLAAAARVSIYAVVLDDVYSDIDVTSYGASPTSGSDRQLRLDGISTLIGLSRGATFVAPAGARGAFERLSRELTGYYLVAFEPLPEERDGKAHDIAVRVRRRGIEVRARREFRVEAERSATMTDDELLADALRSPLTVTEIPLRVVTYNFPDPEDGAIRVLIGAALGRRSDDAPVKALAYRLSDQNGKLITGRRYDVEPPRDDDHRWNGTITVPPGTYALKVATVDTDGRRASVEHQFRASLERAGALSAGDLMLTEAPGRDGGVLHPEIEPTVQTSALGSYFEVASADPALLGRATVLVEVAGDANSAPLVTADGSFRVARDGVRAISVGEASLDPLPPGDYVARAVVRVDGQPVARVLRAFAYAPTSTVVASSLAGLGAGSLRFDRSQILAPAVTGHFLGPLARGLGPDDAARVESAERGDFSALAPGTTGGGPAGASALLRGVSLYAAGDLEAAASHFREALAEDGDLAAATFYLGACYAAGGRHKEAAGAWQTTIAADDQPPFVYVLAAEAFLRARDWESAAALADEASDLWPDDSGILGLRVRALGLAGERDQALETAALYLAARPDDTEMLLLTMKLLYDAHADGRSAGRDVATDRRTFERYLARYRSAGGPQPALAERWLQVLTRTESRE